MKAFLSLSLIAAAIATRVDAATVIFELETDMTPGQELLGFELDTVDDPSDPNSASTATLAGITFVATAASDFGDGTAIFNAAGGGAGVNTGGITVGEADAGIEQGEVLTLTLVFDETLLVVGLVEIDFGGVNGTDDSATYSVAGSPAETVTGPDSIVNFASAPVILVSGDTLVFSNVSEGVFDIEDLTLDIAPIPEPTTSLVMMVGLVSLLGRRRS